MKKILMGWTNPIWKYSFDFYPHLKVRIPTIHRLKPNNNLYQPVKVRITIEEIGGKKNKNQ